MLFKVLLFWVILLQFSNIILTDASYFFLNCSAHISFSSENDTLIKLFLT